MVENERRARQLAGERANRLKTEALARRSGRKMSLEDVFKLAQDGAVKELSLVIKADVAGSLEAIEDEIAKLPQEEVKVNLIHRGVGGINESDVMLAAASQGLILAFNVRPVGEARQAADREGVEIRSYSVIYRAIEELRAAMQGMLEPTEVESALGQAEVRQLFRASSIGTIAGSHRERGHGHPRRQRAGRARGHGRSRTRRSRACDASTRTSARWPPASSAGSCSPTSRICARVTSWRRMRHACRSASFREAILLGRC